MDMYWSCREAAPFLINGRSDTSQLLGLVTRGFQFRSTSVTKSFYVTTTVPYNGRMTVNPLYNALIAITYIIGVVSLVFFATLANGDSESSIFMPMGMLSLLVLSVTVMAYLFFYQPIVMLLDGEREKAVTFFLKTVGIFAVATVLVFIVATLVPGLKF